MCKKDIIKAQEFTAADIGTLRTRKGANGEFLFCLADVCKCLGIANTSQARQRLDARGVITTYTPTYNQHGAEVIQELLFINEPNFYRCIFQSRKEKAVKFQNWIFEVVLPALRKTGFYATQFTPQAKAQPAPFKTVTAIAQELGMDAHILNLHLLGQGIIKKVPSGYNVARNFKKYAMRSWFYGRAGRRSYLLYNQEGQALIKELAKNNWTIKGRGAIYGTF